MVKSSEMSSPLKKLRYRLEWLGLIIAVKLIPLLSRKACYALGQFIGGCIATLDRAGRRVALSNLEVAFGDQLSARRRAQIVRESYQGFIRTMLDLVWSPRINAHNHRAWLETVNVEEALAQAAAGRGVIFVTLHPKVEIPRGASIVQITQLCWNELERIVRANPSPWIWMYKHWPYELSGSAKPYPFYAQAGHDFERRLNQARAELEREIVE